LPSKGRRPGERLEEHHAEGVPVGGGADAARLGLFRRHVPGGADDGAAFGLGDALVHLRAGDEPEVQHHHAALAGDEDVARLEVQVLQAMRVKVSDGLRELPEAAPQSVGVDGTLRQGIGPHGVCEPGGGLFAPPPGGGPEPGKEVHAFGELDGEEPVRLVGDQLVQRGARRRGPKTRI
jgi:hypothetical protein